MSELLIKNPNGFEFGYTAITTLFPENGRAILCIITHNLKFIIYIGYEIGNKFPKNPQALHAALDPLNLQIASQWFSTYFTESNQFIKTMESFEKHMNFLKAMGAEIIVVCECGHAIHRKNEPLFDNKPVFSAAQWKQLIVGLHEMGKLAQDNGMCMVYHEHMGTGVQSEAELHHLMDETNPQLVSLLIDTAHITFAGGDPIRLIHQYGKRIKHVHLKDLRKNVMGHVRPKKWSFLEAVRQGVFTIPGDGFIDYQPIFSALAEQQYHGWFIVEAEQDPKKANPFTYAKNARRFIQTMTGL